MLGRSQDNLTLFRHLERAHIAFGFQTKPAAYKIFKFFILRFLFDFTRQGISNVGLLFPYLVIFF